MNVTILGSGTSSGVPMPCCTCEVCRSADPHDNRLRASALVDRGDDHILIDCGPDFRQQMLRSHTMQLSALLLTHIHYDHASGLDDLRPYGFDRPFDVYAERSVAEVLRQKYDYIFVHRYPGTPQIRLHEVRPGEAFVVGSTEILPIRLMHGSLPILGYRISDLAYLTDCTVVPDSEWPRLAGIRTLVIDALRTTPHPTHMDVAEALAVVDRLHPTTTYFTHMSHQIGLHALVEAGLPEGVHLAYDGLQFTV